ncbi:LysR family transcriptional regulator [Andreprevotia chitinilytica]|uniref:LysR family transcriptional regulator n=1 Tax=Andreprevotia chitinilytica TaxID=396808 RepID=UPI00054F5705|nr:LysR family transcriptional regulator [Andreprevotia chitinilytica]
MSTLRLTLRQLQIFQAVAEHGSTGAAADVIALSQSATSAALNDLEGQLGVRLFDRVGKRLLLNNDGRTLLPQALAVLDGAAGIESWAHDADAQIGALRIGASTTIGNYLLPQLLGEFRQQLPPAAQAGWQASVTIANTAAITQLVANFQLDIGLIEGPCHEPELTVTPWLDDELLIVCAPDDPIRPAESGQPVRMDALRDAVWLLREPGSGTREIINQLLIPHLHHLRAGIEFGNSEAIKRAAANGLGLTCLSRCVVADLIGTGALVALPTSLPRLSRRFHLVMHRQKAQTRGLSRLVAHLLNDPAGAAHASWLA